MSTNEKGVTSSESAVVSLDSTNPHADAAQTRVQELRVMRDQIPRFVIPASPKEASRLSSAASVPREFIELTAVAVANQKALVRGDSATPGEIRDLLHYAEAYGPLADELEALAQFVRFSVNSARNTAGSEALTIYSLAQRLAKRRENAGLAPHAWRTCAASSVACAPLFCPRETTGGLRRAGTAGCVCWPSLTACLSKWPRLSAAARVSTNAAGRAGPPEAPRRPPRAHRPLTPPLPPINNPPRDRLIDRTSVPNGIKSES